MGERQAVLHLLPVQFQVVQFMTNVSSIDPQRLPYKLNSLLPHDIRVCSMSQTATDFNVTVSAQHKVGYIHSGNGPGSDNRGLQWSSLARYSGVVGAVSFQYVVLLWLNAG